MSRYLLATGFFVLFLLRCVVADDPCTGPCAALNASIAACGTSDLMTCLCQNLDFTSDAQTCYDCRQAQGDTALLGEVSTFLNLCNSNQTIPSATANIPPMSNSLNPAVTASASSVGLTTNTLNGGGTTTAAATTGTTHTSASTKSASSGTSTAVQASSGIKKMVDYRNYLGIVSMTVLCLKTIF